MRHEKWLAWVPWILAAAGCGIAAYLAFPHACLAVATHWAVGLSRTCAGTKDPIAWSFVEPSPSGCDNPDPVGHARQSLRAIRFLGISEQRIGKTADSLYVRGMLAAAEGQDAEGSRLLALASALRPEDPRIRLRYGISLADLARQIDSPELYVQAFDEMLRASSQNGFPPVGFHDLAVLADLIPAPRMAIRFWEIAAAHRGLGTNIHGRSIIGLERAKARIDRRRSLANSPFDATSLSAIPGYAEWTLHKALGGLLSARGLQQADLQILSQFLKEQRGDSWLAELLKTPAPSSPERTLSAAFQANQSGQHQAAVESARTALNAYRNSHNLPGEVAASVELAAGYRRQMQIAKCLAAIDGVAQRALANGYKWFYLRARFEQLSCQSETRLIDVLAAREELAAEAATSGFVDLQLRTTGAVVEPFHSFATPAASWRRGHQALSLFWRTPLAGTNASNLYVPLSMAAANQGLTEAASALMEEASAVLADTPNQPLYAVVLLETGRAIMRTAKRDGAKAYFDLAEKIDPALGFESRIAKSELALALGNTAESLQMLLAAEQERNLAYRTLSYYQRLQLLPALGRAHLSANRVEDAIRDFTTVTSETESHARANRDPQQRYGAMAEGEAGWRGLMEGQYRSGLPDLALATWQTLRNGGNPFVPIAAEAEAETAWISFAATDSGYVAWLRMGPHLHHRAFPSDGAAAKVNSLIRLAGDPDSPSASIREVARELGKTLFGPFESELRGARTLIIDADQSLEQLPWAVLELGGRPLIDNHPIALTRGWNEALRRNQPVAVSLKELRHPLIVRRAMVDPSVSSQFPLLISADHETTFLRRSEDPAELTGRGATVRQIMERLPKAGLFHFTGHSITWGSAGGLVVAPERAEPFGLLTASMLSGHDWSHLQLVVLASCTSAGAGLRTHPNFESVARAFLHGGARRVVASRWNVDAVSTADLLERFYGSISSGHSAAAAMQAAMLATKSQPHSSHPYYWAGLALFGSP